MQSEIRIIKKSQKTQQQTVVVRNVYDTLSSDDLKVRIDDTIRRVVMALEDLKELRREVCSR
jgi:hypothetical protein